MNSVSIDIKKRCFIPIQFATYLDKIWCDIVIMDVGHIILGRPCLYDLDVTIYGRSKFCSFVYDETKFNVHPPDTKRPEASSNKKALNLISLKSLDKDNLENFLQCLVGVNLRN